MFSKIFSADPKSRLSGSNRLSFSSSICTWIFGLIVVITLTEPLYARDLTNLQAEFWVDIEPFGSVGPAPGLNQEQAAKAVLEEAQAIFSGMIYGYDFVYVPGDAARKVTEAFTLTQQTKIAWGDKDMEIREVRRDQFAQYLRARYLLKPFETSLLESWSASHTISSGGTGVVSYFKGAAGKVSAMEEAVKDAIRNYARGITHNKPARIEGHVVLWDAPQNAVVSGQYRSRVVVRLLVTTLEQYQTF